MRTFTKSEDPDEMLHSFAFHLDLHVHFLMIQKRSSERKIGLQY